MCVRFHGIKGRRVINGCGRKMICLLVCDDLSDGDNVAFNILYTFLVAFNDLFASRVYIILIHVVVLFC